MGQLRFSIKGLLAAVAVVAIGCVALMNASAFLSALTSGLALLILFMSVLMILFRQTETRAFWIGFTIFGWGYLFVIGPNPFHSLGNLTDYLLRQVLAQVKVPLGHYFLDIGHYLFALAFALLGGVIARWVYSTGPGRKVE